MRRRRHLEVSTFPFLAVLLCTMGALIFLLLVFDRRAKIVAQLKARRDYALVQAEKDQRAQEHKRRFDESQRLAAERQAEWEKRSQELHAALALQEEELVEKIQQTQDRVAAATAQLQAEKTRAEQQKSQLQLAQLRFAGIEQTIKSEQSATARAVQQSEATKRELERQTADLMRLEQTLMNLKALRERQKNTYSLVPYLGRRGDNRKPLYVECAGSGVIFHPDRVAVGTSKVAAAMLRAEVEQRVARLTEQKSPEPGQLPSRPYVLVLVRPDGISNYYRLQEALGGLQLDFGYEFIEPDWVLDFSGDGSDPAAQPWMKAAKLPPQLPPQSLQPPPPNGGWGQGPTGNGLSWNPSGNGGSPGSGEGRATAGGFGSGNGTGSTAGSGTGGGGTWNGGPALPGGTGQGSGSGPALPGSIGQRSGSGPGNSGVAANGSGLGFGGGAPPPVPGMPQLISGGRGGGGGGGPQWQQAAASAGQAGGGSALPQGLPGASVGTGSLSGPPGGGNAPGNGNGSALPGNPTGPYSGSAPQGNSAGSGSGGSSPGNASANGSGVAPHGTAGGNGSGDSQPGNITANSGGGSPQGNTTANSSGASPQGNATANSGGGSPQGNTTANSSGASPQGNATANSGGGSSPGNATGSGSGGSQGGGGGGMASSVSGGGHTASGDGSGGVGMGSGLAILGQPLTSGGKQPSSSPSPPLGRILSNRDWVISIECAADGVVVTQGNQKFSLETLSAKNKGEHPLVQAVKQMIARRQATVRQGEPPYRPLLRFQVKPEGLRAYYLAYPLLDGLGLPMTRENLAGR